MSRILLLCAFVIITTSALEVNFFELAGLGEAEKMFFGLTNKDPKPLDTNYLPDTSTLCWKDRVAEFKAEHNRVKLFDVIGGKFFLDGLLSYFHLFRGARYIGSFVRDLGRDFTKAFKSFGLHTIGDLFWYPINQVLNIVATLLGVITAPPKYAFCGMIVD